VPADTDYQLLDVGDGRKLERFGPYLLDRPFPGALDTEKSQPSAWADAVYYERTTGEQGIWRPRDALQDQWPVTCGPLTLEIKPTDFGHVGVFPEQLANWAWLAEQVSRSMSERASEVASPPLKILNLFAYTGGSTLAAAQAGAAVTHVDAARNIVAWARRNAEHNQLASQPIRWITEDAVTFVRRELKRGNSYQGVILDPPSFGRGPDGQMWKFEQLPELLDGCVQLMAADPRLLLLTGHTTGVSAVDLKQVLSVAVRSFGGKVESGPMVLTDVRGRVHPCGVFARWAVDS